MDDLVGAGKIDYEDIKKLTNLESPMTPQTNNPTPTPTPNEIRD